MVIYALAHHWIKPHEARLVSLHVILLSMHDVVRSFRESRIVSKKMSFWPLMFVVLVNAAQVEEVEIGTWSALKSVASVGGKEQENGNWSISETSRDQP